MPKLTLLGLTNFRCFDEAEVEFPQPVTYITGPNAVGKSTLLDAIQWCATGICRGTDGGGGGAEILARLGEDPATTTVVMKIGEHELARRIGEGPRSKAGKEILTKLGVSADVALVCLGWASFINMPADRARSVLLESLGVEVDDAAIKEILGEDAAHVPIESFENNEAIAVAHKKCYAERTALARQIKDSGSIDLSGYPDSIRAMTAAQATQQIEGAKVRLKKLEADLEKAEKAAAKGDAEKQAEKESLEQSLKLTQEEIRLEGEKLKALDTDQGDMKLLEKAAAETKDALQRAIKVHDDCRVKLAEHEAMLGLLKRNRDELTTDEGVPAGKCPMCTRKLPPTTGKALLKTITGQIDTTIEAIRETQETINNLNIEALKEARDDAATARDDAELRHRERTAKAKMIGDRLHELHEKVAQIQADLAVEVSSQEPEPEPHDDPNILRQRISRGRELIAQAESYLHDRKSQDRQEGLVAQARTKHQAMDRLCDLLSPKGKVVETLLGPKIKPFIDRINLALKPFGYGAAIRLDQGLEIAVRRLSEDDTLNRPFRMLSDSEQVRMGMAIQASFAVDSGFGLIATDEVSRLDVEGRGELIQAVKEAMGAGVEQVILAGTMPSARGEYKPPSIPGWEFVEVE